MASSWRWPIGNISITAEREGRLDFSHPVLDAGLQILIPEEGGSLGIVSAVFTWEMLVWVLIAVLVIFVIGNLMWWFERRDAPYFQHSYRDGLWPSFWYAMHVMISGGFEEHVPRSVPARVLGIALVDCSRPSPCPWQGICLVSGNCMKMPPAPSLCASVVRSMRPRGAVGTSRQHAVDGHPERRGGGPRWEK